MFATFGNPCWCIAPGAQLRVVLVRMMSWLCQGCSTSLQRSRDGHANDSGNSHVLSEVRDVSKSFLRSYSEFITILHFCLHTYLFFRWPPEEQDAARIVFFSLVPCGPESIQFCSASMKAFGWSPVIGIYGHQSAPRSNAWFLSPEHGMGECGPVLLKVLTPEGALISGREHTSGSPTKLTSFSAVPRYRKKRSVTR